MKLKFFVSIKKEKTLACQNFNSMFCGILVLEAEVVQLA